MAYETKSTGTYTSVGNNELNPLYNDTERDSSFDTDYNPVGEFYSVGIDQTPGLKERIIDVHGADSEQIGFINELEDFLGDSDKYSQASQKFKTYVRNHINTPRNTDYLVDEFVNSGYIMALERLRAPNSENDLDFYKDYAATHSMTVPQAVLFGPNGTARQAFSKWGIEELLRGQHRSNYKPENKQMAQAYDKAANNTYRLPEAKNKDGEQEQIDISDDKGKLPEGLEGQIVNAFNREQGIHDEWKNGQRVPEKLETMVDKIKKVDWLVDNAMLVFEDKSPAVSKEIAIQSNGKDWTDEQEKQNKRYVMQSSTSIDRDTGRIRISVYSPGFGEKRVLAEEVYHIIFEIIRETSPGTYKATQQWHKKRLKEGADPTHTIREAFASEMALEEAGVSTSLPRTVVKHAREVFSDKNNIQPCVLEKVKSNLSAPQMSVSIKPRKKFN